MRKLLLLFAFIAASLTGYSQKKPLDHSVYDSWKSLNSPALTKDGSFAIYSINQQEGDTKLVLANTITGETINFERATGAKFTDNNAAITFTIKPFYNDVKVAKQKKKKPDEMPKDSLGVYIIKTKSFKKIPFLKSYKLGSESNDYLAFQTNPPADTSKTKKESKTTVKKEKEEGANLFVYKIADGSIDTLKYIAEYDFDKGGNKLYFIRKPNSKDSLFSSGLYVYYPKTKKTVAILNIHKKQVVKLPQINDSCGKAAFFAYLDTTKAGKKNVSIFTMDKDSDIPVEVINNKTVGITDKWRVTDNFAIFSKDGKRLFVGTAPIMPEKDTSIDVSEKAKLDIWHYQQPYIQPYQLLNIQRELKKSYLAYVNLENNSGLIQLANEELPSVTIPNNMVCDWGYSNTNKAYEMETQWSSDPHSDIYVVNVKDGTSKNLKKDGYYRGVSASESGKYLAWFDLSDNQYYTYNVAEDKLVCISKGINTVLTDEMHDTPEMNNPYGIGGWMDNEKAIFIYDRYDVWRVDPAGIIPPINLTNGVGKSENKTFRIVRLDEEMSPMGFRIRGSKRAPLNDKSTVYFTVFDNITKQNGFYSKDLSKKSSTPVQLLMEPNSFAQTTKAKDSKTIIYIKSNFNESPNIWFTKDFFKTQKKLSDINPQMKEYNWGTVSLYKWKTRNGFESEGILYKPEDFDSTKKYPMIVYFYETHSEGLYNYLSPQPSRSTINIPYFVSNGYLVFTPDIHYTIGHPGQSALDCIVPGVELLCENKWVDKENIGIQGQSWGGYQVAYMVTRPDVFKWKAGGAGAPVSNMTSAYGGVRWGSGMVRQFQYEDTQSRIGKTLWEGLDLYIENSPLFHANKVATPLLIMHNDKDDAVPWYQGIEYFTALKRLGKPVWMLQYNDEFHNLREKVNAKDLSIRLQQFFDHFLKGKPMPVWMKTGVPATMKGIDWGFDLTE